MKNTTKIGTWFSDSQCEFPTSYDKYIFSISYELLKIKHAVLLVVEAGMSYFIQVLHQTCVNGAVIFKNVRRVKCKY